MKWQLHIAAMAAFAVSACDRVFGLDETGYTPGIDAAYFDGPADAPFSCPAGGAAPVFAQVLTPVPGSCYYYQRAAASDVAAALCSDTGMQRVSIGAADAVLVPVAELAPVGNERFDAPQLTPEGDHLVVRHWNTGTVTSTLEVYSIAGANVTRTHDVVLAGTTFDSFVKVGHPSAGPTRRMFIQNGPVDPIVELSVDATGTASIVHSYQLGDLGVTSIYSMPSLSSDGLRAVFTGNGGSSGAFYSARNSVDVTFGPATPIDNVPANSDAFMTEDCSRLYFSVAGSVYWVQQR